MLDIHFGTLAMWMVGLGVRQCGCDRFSNAGDGIVLVMWEVGQRWQCGWRDSVDSVAGAIAFGLWDSAASVVVR